MSQGLKNRGWRQKGAADDSGDSGTGALVRASEGFQLVDHLLTVPVANGGPQGFLQCVISGAATGISGSGEPGTPGIATLTTGTTNAGNVQLRTVATAIAGLAGNETLDLEIRFRIPVISDGTETFVVRVGFGDNPTADHTDGVYLEINANATANMQAKSANNGTRTTVDTGVPALAGSFYRARFQVSATQAIVTIDGITVATLSTNLPATGRTFGAGVFILKSAGTTARTVDVDYIDLRYDA
jgi:hypothetical protein